MNEDQQLIKELAMCLIETQAKLIDLAPTPMTMTKKYLDDYAIDGGLWDRMNKAVEKATKIISI